MMAPNGGNVVIYHNGNHHNIMNTTTKHNRWKKYLQETGNHCWIVVVVFITLCPEEYKPNLVSH